MHEPPRRVVALLPVDGDVADPAAVAFDELLGLHEHATGAAARVVDAALVRLQHFDQHAHDRARRVELAAALALGAGEAAEKVFVDAAENVLGLVARLAHADPGDEVDQFAQHHLVERRAIVVLGQHALEAGIGLLDLGHRVVDQLADGRLLGVVLQMRPARFLGHPEHVLGQILVRVFGSGGVLRQQRRALRLEGVGDVLEKDQAERDVLVVGRFEVLAQLVGGEEQLRLEAEIGSVAVRLLRLGRLGGFSVAGRTLWASPRHDCSSILIARSCVIGASLFYGAPEA